MFVADRQKMKVTLYKKFSFMQLFIFFILICSF